MRKWRKEYGRMRAVERRGANEAGWPEYEGGEGDPSAGPFGSKLFGLLFLRPPWVSSVGPTTPTTNISRMRKWRKEYSRMRAVERRGANEAGWPEYEGGEGDPSAGPFGSKPFGLLFLRPPWVSSVGPTTPTTK
ncbi:hypothetical protein E3N88_25951 [Mikania micrantha]|uniref:Uncharacterized protein n=1 Tax=Mikania micrantha TaxID=192012 RepID=A0A5N6N757_9ASTR|nr:hypothetical protein E3N88_25951 [Mikania micrantha]